MEETKIPNAPKAHGIVFAEAGFIWKNAVNPDFIAYRLEGLEETKIPNALKAHGIVLAEAGFIWKNAVNPDSIAYRLEGLGETKTQKCFSALWDCICRSGIYLEKRS